MFGMRYEAGGTGDRRRPPQPRCPLCEFPIGNGFQPSCEPGVCLFTEVPRFYKRTRIKA